MTQVPDDTPREDRALPDAEGADDPRAARSTASDAPVPSNERQAVPNAPVASSGPSDSDGAALPGIFPAPWTQRLVTSALVVVLLAAAFAVGRSTGGHGHGGGHADHDHDHADHDHADHDHAAESGGVEYICPMHPQIRQENFGTCPICFMDLVPVEKGADDGVPAVRLRDDVAARARVRTEVVRRVPLERELRLFGRLERSEAAEVDLTAWIPGRVDRLHVRETGVRVRRGQRIATVYSRELIAAQQALLQADRTLREAGGETEAARVGESPRVAAARSAREAARTELRLLGLSARQIDDILAQGAVQETVDIHARAAGTVIRRAVNEGDWVAEGDTLLQLAALDTVWAQLEVFERDLPHVRPGQRVVLRLPAFGDRDFEGEIVFIEPVLDPVRRVARARVVLSNEEGVLAPGMFVRAVVRVPHTERPVPLSVPASAVLWTGPRSVVYVLDGFLSPPGYVPAEVVLGERIGDRWIVRDGVYETENVVVEGAFRLDANLQITGGPSMMGRFNTREEDGEASPSGGGHDH